jgi:hypothetical protein
MIIIWCDADIWYVGSENHEGTTTALMQTAAKEEAMAWISYLNGGLHPFLGDEAPLILRRSKYET